MDIGTLGDIVSLQQNRTQAGLQKDVNRLSTGLRINSAVDDPSGLAISQVLQSRVNGLDQGVQSVQNATNALTVADGAMATIGSIMQRLRTLVVGANSGLESANDVADNQAEINSLVTEINHISSSTTFNGRVLLDGSLSSDPTVPAQILQVVNNQISSGGNVIDSTVDPSEPAATPNAPQVIQTLTVDSYDPTTNELSVSGTMESTDGSYGPPQPFQFFVLAGTNFAVGDFPPAPGTPEFLQTDQNGNPVMSFNIGTLTAADVGKTSTLLTVDATTKATGQNLNVNDGAGEGSTVSVDIPPINSQNLGVNGLTLGDPLINSACEYRVDYGIQKLATARAQVGAQIVSLQEDAANASTTSVALQASESSIADANVGHEVSQFVLDQVRSQMQPSVLRRLYKAAPAVLALVNGAPLP